ncbi:hypothetical protein Y032_0046g1379 [Ancylostoma ceylanicum]|uniref:Uncharacterized protein n=1 Tax=Ancylostoma ceylanicum TaxID=53326 RepID=A0A016UDN1_9BILA|nr:hypothetical protein Y032_0046g1379 [Ancylostoma ceylanicum]
MLQNGYAAPSTGPDPGQLCSSKPKAWFSHPSNFWNSLVLCSYLPRSSVDFAHTSRNRLQEYETTFYSA